MHGSVRKFTAMSTFLGRLIFSILLLHTSCIADHVVYLDRPANSQNIEPWFNPNNIAANVGEQVHFIARFSNQRPYYAGVKAVLDTLTIRVILHLNGPLRNQLMTRHAFGMEVIQVIIISDRRNILRLLLCRRRWHMEWFSFYYHCTRYSASFFLLFNLENGSGGAVLCTIRNLGCAF
jgi:hypothetical protein